MSVTIGGVPNPSRTLQSIHAPVSVNGMISKTINVDAFSKDTSKYAQYAKEFGKRKPFHLIMNEKIQAQGSK